MKKIILVIFLLINIIYTQQHNFKHDYCEKDEDCWKGDNHKDFICTE